MKPEGVWRCNACGAMHSLVTVRGPDPQYCPSCGSDRYVALREQDLDAAEDALASIQDPAVRVRSPVVRAVLWALMIWGRLVLARARRRQEREEG